jgi:hypothetical protein
MFVYYQTTSTSTFSLTHLLTFVLTILTSYEGNQALVHRAPGQVFRCALLVPGRAGDVRLGGRQREDVGRELAQVSLHFRPW